MTLPRVARLGLFFFAFVPACSSDPSADSSAEGVVGGGGDLDKLIAAATADGDTRGVRLLEAADTAFQMGRPGPVNYIVIHDIEGSASSAVNKFTAKGDESSAHYVVDKSGKIVQVVRERDIANHAFHSVYNGYGIGIEHAGFAHAGDYTRAEYEASAGLVAEVAARHGVPLDRQHIVGHSQVPTKDTVIAPCAPTATTCGGQDGHQDPGPSWDWDLYMSLVVAKAKAIGYAGPPDGEQAARVLTVIASVEKLPLDKALFGGYWATQCTADDALRQTAYRLVVDASGPRFETRYLQPTFGVCGAAQDGVFPIVLHGFPTSRPPRPDLDVSGLTIARCVGGKKQLFRVEGQTLPCADGTGCAEDVAALVRQADGC